MAEDILSFCKEEGLILLFFLVIMPLFAFCICMLQSCFIFVMKLATTAWLLMGTGFLISMPILKIFPRSGIWAIVTGMVISVYCWYLYFAPMVTGYEWTWEKIFMMLFCLP